LTPPGGVTAQAGGGAGGRSCAPLHAVRTIAETSEETPRSRAPRIAPLLLEASERRQRIFIPRNR
jgi:hypothetical protein